MHGINLYLTQLGISFSRRTNPCFLRSITHKAFFSNFINIKADFSIPANEKSFAALNLIYIFSMLLYCLDILTVRTKSSCRVGRIIQNINIWIILYLQRTSFFQNIKSFTTVKGHLSPRKEIPLLRGYLSRGLCVGLNIQTPLKEEIFLYIPLIKGISVIQITSLREYFLSA